MSVAQEKNELGKKNMSWSTGRNYERAPDMVLKTKKHKLLYSSATWQMVTKTPAWDNRAL